VAIHVIIKCVKIEKDSLIREVNSSDGTSEDHHPLVLNGKRLYRYDFDTHLVNVQEPVHEIEWFLDNNKINKNIDLRWWNNTYVESYFDISKVFKPDEIIQCFESMWKIMKDNREQFSYGYCCKDKDTNEMHSQGTVFYNNKLIYFSCDLDYFILQQERTRKSIYLENQLPVTLECNKCDEEKSFLGKMKKVPGEPINLTFYKEPMDIYLDWVRQGFMDVCNFAKINGLKVLITRL